MNVFPARIVLWLALVPMALAAAPSAIPNREKCDSPKAVEIIQGALRKTQPLEARGEAEGSFLAYRKAARTILEGFPECEDIRGRLEDSLDRTEAMGRSVDRAQELRGTFDSILQDYLPKAPPPTMRTESRATAGVVPTPDIPSATREGCGEWEMEGTAGDGCPQGDDFIYWMSDPYFLMLEIILLGLLFLIREVRRLRGIRNGPSRIPFVRPYRYRTMPERVVRLGKGDALRSRRARH